MHIAVSPFDDQTEFAIQYLLLGRGDARSLVYRLAFDYPHQPALELVFCMSVAASGIESTLSSEADRKAAQESWRMAALVAADIYVMQSLDLPHTRAGDLLTYWAGHDPYFLPVH